MKKMDEKIFVNRKEKKKRKIGVKVIVLIILLALGLFTGLIGFITDFLWFKELGYVGVFFTFRSISPAVRKSILYSCGCSFQDTSYRTFFDTIRTPEM